MRAPAAPEDTKTTACNTGGLGLGEWTCRDPAWGVRDLRDLVSAAEAVGFHLEADVPVANNNTALTFRL